MQKRRLENKEQQRRAKERFRNAKCIETEYMRVLRNLVKQIDQMVKSTVTPGTVANTIELQNMLRQYGRAITPWARASAEKIIARIAKKDEQSWIQLGDTIGKEIRKELNEAPTGQILRNFLEEQVVLITSLPFEAADRVHKLTIEGLATGRRAEDIAKDIRETGSVSQSRAQLIARTEVARTAAALTKARAEFVGSTHYIWRTSADGTVRESHKKMNGKVIAWNDPPEVDPGYSYHAGMFPNCRCWPEPILTE